MAENAALLAPTPLARPRRQVLGPDSPEHLPGAPGRLAGLRCDVRNRLFAAERRGMRKLDPVEGSDCPPFAGRLTLRERPVKVLGDLLRGVGLRSHEASHARRSHNQRVVEELPGFALVADALLARESGPGPLELRELGPESGLLPQEVQLEPLYPLGSL